MFHADVEAGVDGDDCGYISQHAFDFAGSAVSLEIVTLPDEGEVWLFVEDPDEDNGVGTNVYGGTLSVDAVVDTTLYNYASLPFDATAHRFIRLREEGGTTHWEASPDGVTFSELHAASTGFEPTMLRTVFGAGAAGVTTSALTVELDNLNITPTWADRARSRPDHLAHAGAGRT